MKTFRKLSDFQTEPIPEPDWIGFRMLARLPELAGVPRRWLRRVALKELMDNALDEVTQEGTWPAAGAVRIEALEDGRYLVHDDGPGIDPSKVPALFAINRQRTSSKRWRMPFRGVLGNGLRVVVGLITATGGTLEVLTRGRHLVLATRANGSTAVISDTSEASTVERGMTVIVGFGATSGASIDEQDRQPTYWAVQAVELSKTGEPFRGLPSPFWIDRDHWVSQLALQPDRRTIREIIAGFEGCSGPKAGRIVRSLGLKGRVANGLTEDEAVSTLIAARSATKPVRPRRLGAIGPRRDWTGYGKAEGEITEGGHAPIAQIPVVVEVWGKQIAPRRDWARMVPLFVNRTPVTTGALYASALADQHCSVSGFELLATFKSSPGAYVYEASIVTPLMPITSAGKEPSLAQFEGVMAEAFAQATRRAHAAWKAEGHEDEQQGEAESGRAGTPPAAPKPPDPPKPKRVSLKKAVFANIDAAITSVRERPSGQPGSFNQRHLYYELRDVVQKAAARGLTGDRFGAIITEYEDKFGPIAGMHRDPRGMLYLPHADDLPRGRASMPVGTLSVAEFVRPELHFGSLLYVEKKGVAEILRDEGFADRWDCALLGGEGFSTRAIRDLIDHIEDRGEPCKFFCLHDADASGSLIYQTLQEATKARPRRLVEIVNIGIEPWTALEMGLKPEGIMRKTQKRLPVADYVRARADGAKWEQWLQHNRVEINALRPAALIDYLEGQFRQHRVHKVIPPDRQSRSLVRGHLRSMLAAEISGEVEPEIFAKVAQLERELAEIMAARREEIDRLRLERARAIDRRVDDEMKDLRLPNAQRLRASIAKKLSQQPSARWHWAINFVACDIFAQTGFVAKRRSKKATE